MGWKRGEVLSGKMGRVKGGKRVYGYRRKIG